MGLRLFRIAGLERLDCQMNSNRILLGAGAALALGGAVVLALRQRRQRPILLYMPRGAPPAWFLGLARILTGQAEEKVEEEEEEEEKWVVPAEKDSTLAEVHKVLDFVEQFIVPLACAGACEGNHPVGAALVHRTTKQCLASAAAQTSSNPLRVPELTVIEAGLNLLSARAANHKDAPPAVHLKDYLLVSTHPLSSLAQEAVLAACVGRVLVLFPEGAESYSQPSSRSVAGSASSRCSQLGLIESLGVVAPGTRSFDSEAALERSLRRDRGVMRAQQRVLVLGGVFARLEAAAKDSSRGQNGLLL